MKAYLAPDDSYIDDLNEDTTVVFFGGSIEMGKAEPWQEKLTEYFEKFEDDIFILNPLRTDWDSSWVQDPTEGTEFHEQVTWELHGQDYSDIHVYYFDPKTQSPITLLELGSYGTLNPSGTIVCCPKEYFRYGNVVIFCKQHDITLVESFDELTATLDDWLSVEI